MTEVIAAIIAAIVSVIGVFLANSYARQTKVKLADTRREAYAKLWEITEVASPTRLTKRGKSGVLTRDERLKLNDDLTHWYYDNGHGLLLERDTREIYLAAKENLICDASTTCPAHLLCFLPTHLNSQEKLGCSAIRQLSLLRTQMKADLAIYGELYHETLTTHDYAFLRASGVNLYAKPWRTALRKVRTVADFDTELCGTKPSGSRHTHDCTVARDPGTDMPSRHSTWRAYIGSLIWGGITNGFHTRFSRLMRLPPDPACRCHTGNDPGRT